MLHGLGELAEIDQRVRQVVVRACQRVGIAYLARHRQQSKPSLAGRLEPARAIQQCNLRDRQEQTRARIAMGFEDRFAFRKHAARLVEVSRFLQRDRARKAGERAIKDERLERLENLDRLVEDRQRVLVAAEITEGERAIHTCGPPGASDLRIRIPIARKRIRDGFRPLRASQRIRRVAFGPHDDLADQFRDRAAPMRVPGVECGSHRSQLVLQLCPFAIQNGLAARDRRGAVNRMQRLVHSARGAQRPCVRRPRARAQHRQRQKRLRRNCDGIHVPDHEAGDRQRARHIRPNRVVGLGQQRAERCLGVGIGMIPQPDIPLRGRNLR